MPFFRWVLGSCRYRHLMGGGWSWTSIPPLGCRLLHPFHRANKTIVAVCPWSWTLTCSSACDVWLLLGYLLTSCVRIIVRWLKETFSSSKFILRLLYLVTPRNLLGLFAICSGIKKGLRAGPWMFCKQGISVNIHPGIIYCFFCWFSFSALSRASSLFFQYWISRGLRADVSQ